jgi:hypothetical protein
MVDEPLTPWRWPTLRLRPALRLLGVFLIIGLLNANAVLLLIRMDGGSTPWGKPYVWEFTGALGVYFCIPIIMTAVLNAPNPQQRWVRFLAIHLGAFALFALLAPALFFGMRTLIYSALGWGPYTFGPLRLQLPMEWQKQVIVYAGSFLTISYFNHLQEAQAKAQRETELQAKLQEARLQALSAQLDPHFLFNALNTVSSLMYQDLKRTDRLLTSLGQMLRDGLESGTPFWPLRRELQHLDAFLDFALARFERLRVERRIEPGLEDLPVPRFGLQRLVENALKHNQDQVGTPLVVRISARRVGAVAELEVADDGKGFEDPGARADASGIGLKNLRECLALRYGSSAELRTRNPEKGGAAVQITIPAGSVP